MGMTDAAQRQQAIRNDVAQIAATAQQRGVNFGEMLYSLARAQGYTPKEAAQAAAIEQAATAQPTQAERQVATIERGRAMSQTLGTAGTAPPTRLTPEKIASMSDAEFSKVYAKVAKDPAAMRQMFGE
jgi:hypothetical protein